RFVFSCLMLASLLAIRFAAAEEPLDPKALEAAKAFMLARFMSAPANTFFKPSEVELEKALHGDPGAANKAPLQFPKGNGVRLLMTGHSWVAPAVKTLPGIAAAGGFDGHHQRSHNSGGMTGSANSIWLTEFGKFQNKPATPIILPALATGQWDVLSWGSYY